MREKKACNILPVIAIAVSCVSNASIISGNHSINVKHYAVTNVESIKDIEERVTNTARENGMETHGLTSTDYKWSHSSEPVERGGAKCKLTEINIVAETVVTLPKLQNPGLSQHERAQWEQSYAGLVEHELLHYKNHQQAYAQMVSQANDFEAPCGVFPKRLGSAFTQLMTDHKAIDRQIDSGQ